MISLRGYQEETKRLVRTAFKEYKSVCLQMPTGSGKTILAASVASDVLSNLARKKSRGHILYLVHRKELLNQTSLKMVELGIKDIGEIVPGSPESPWALLQIASIQSVYARMKRLNWLNPKFIIIDEAHHARAATWEKVIQRWPKAFTLGLTATPARQDGKGLGTLFKTLVKGPTIRELIEDGSLCDLEVYSTSGISLKDVRKTAGDYNKKDLDKRATGKYVANTTANWERIAKGKRTIHYAVTRRHSKDFIDKIKSLGVTAEHVDGTTPKYEREEIFKRFSRGEIQVVSNVNLITEGFDCPECQCVIIRPTMSTVDFMQMIGRVLRPKPNGEKGIVLDVGGNFDASRHGDPREEYEWSLESGIEIHTSKKKNKGIKICKKCLFVYATHINECPSCGAETETKKVEEVDVKLQKLEEDELAKRREKRKAKLTRRELNSRILSTQGDLEKLQKLAIEYGYNKRAAFVWKKKFSMYFKYQNAYRGIGGE